MENKNNIASTIVIASAGAGVVLAAVLWRLSSDLRTASANRSSVDFLAEQILDSAGKAALFGDRLYSIQNALNLVQSPLMCAKTAELISSHLALFEPLAQPGLSELPPSQMSLIGPFLMASLLVFCIGAAVFKAYAVLVNTRFHGDSLSEYFRHLSKYVKENGDTLLYYTLLGFFFLECCWFLGNVLAVITLSLRATSWSTCVTWQGVLGAISHLSRKITEEILAFSLLQQLVWDPKKSLTKFIMDGSGVFYCISRYRALRKKHQKGSTFLKHGFSSRVVIVLNMLSRCGEALAVRTIKDASLEELFPDAWVVDRIVEPAASQADSFHESGGLKTRAILELDAGQSDEDTRKVRSQLRDFVSALFVQCHITEALTHDCVQGEEALDADHAASAPTRDFVFALVHEKEQSVARKINDKTSLIIIRKDELLSFNPALHEGLQGLGGGGNGSGTGNGPSPLLPPALKRGLSICTAVLNNKRFQTLWDLKSIVEADDNTAATSSTGHKFLVGQLKIHSPMTTSAHAVNRIISSSAPASVSNDLHGECTFTGPCFGLHSLSAIEEEPSSVSWGSPGSPEPLFVQLAPGVSIASVESAASCCD